MVEAANGKADREQANAALPEEDSTQMPSNQGDEPKGEKEEEEEEDTKGLLTSDEEGRSSPLQDVPEESESRAESRLDDQEAVVAQYLASQISQPADKPGALSQIDLREVQTQPPDGGWGWIVVFGSFLSMIVVDGICFSFGIFLNDLEEEFQTSKQKITWCNSLLTGMYLVAGPGASALVNRFDYRCVVMIGSVGASISFMAASFITNVDAFIIVFGVCGGLCFGLIYLPGVTIVGYWFTSRRATATGVAVCGSGIGMMIFGLISPPLIEAYSWRGALMIFSGVILHCMIAGAFFMSLETFYHMRQQARIRAHQRNLIRKAAEATGQLEDSPKASLLKGKKMSRLNAAVEEKDSEPKQNGPFKSKKKKSKPKPVAKKQKLAIHRNSIMQKIIEEKQRQRNTSVGSLDGMIITRENQLIEPPADYQERPMLSMNAIHRIVDNVLRRQAERRSTTGSALGLSSGHLETGGRSRQNSSRSAAAAYLKTSMPHLVSEYISQQSLAAHRMSTALASNQSLSKEAHLLRPNLTITPANSTTTSTGFPFSSVISLNPWIEQMNQEGISIGPEAREEIVSEIRREVAKPMNRMDIFFSGSIQQLPHYVSHPQMDEFIRSVTNLPDEANATKADIQRLFDLSILKSKTFLLLSLSSIFSMLGFLIPYAFVADYAAHMGIPKKMGALVISIIGFANTIGRILSGVISDRPWADCLWINNVTLIIAGLVTMLLPFFKVFELLAVYAVIFGLCIAAFASLRSIIIVELLGLEKLTNAFGFLLLIQGVAIMVGPPFAGSFYDRYQSFDMTFYLGGGFMFVSGLLCLPVRRIANFERRQAMRREAERRAASSENSQIDQCVSAV